MPSPTTYALRSYNIELFLFMTAVGIIRDPEGRAECRGTLEGLSVV